MHLTRRDLAILEDLAARRADTLAGLHARHFAALTTQRARNRLGELAGAGFLVRHPYDPGPGPSTSAYTLGRRAPAALRLRSLAGEHVTGRRVLAPEESSIPHQLAVNRVGTYSARG